MSTVFIADRDNRDITSLIYHYCKMGWKVFLPKPGSEGFGHQPSWPRLVLKSTNDPTKRNLDVHGYEQYDDVKFGEDRFLSQEIEEIQQKLYETDASCELIDINVDKVHIDAWHTTPNSILDVGTWMEYAKKHFPHAKWISSCMTHWDHNLQGSPQNVVKFLPANYRDAHPRLNQVAMYRHRIEFDVMNVDYNEVKDRSGWASFNHNFAVRQPQYWEIQQNLNKLLEGKVNIPNYGGNIRVVGADIKFSGENGITGKDLTISPRQAMKKYTELRGVMHLKQADWAGGVPSMSRMAKVPIIVTGKYVQDTKSEKVLVHDRNCFIANDMEELVKYTTLINDDDFVWAKLAMGQDNMNDAIFDDAYWKSWDEFLGKLA